MRTAAIALLLLLAMTVVPSSASAGCRIDLGDPTNPRVYGECVDLQLAETNEQQGAREFRIGGRADFAFDAPARGLCDGDRCTYIVSQYIIVRITPNDEGPVPFVDVRSEGGAFGIAPMTIDGPCEVVLDPLTGVVAPGSCGPAYS